MNAWRQRLDPGVSQEPQRPECVRLLHDGLFRRYGADGRPPRLAVDPPHRRCRADYRGRTRAGHGRARREGLYSRDGFLNGVPFPMHFFLATVMLLAAAGDVRILRFGVARGGPRLARHLWRMCFAVVHMSGAGLVGGEKHSAYGSLRLPRRSS